MIKILEFSENFQNYFLENTYMYLSPIFITSSNARFQYRSKLPVENIVAFESKSNFNKLQIQFYNYDDSSAM